MKRGVYKRQDWSGEGWYIRYADVTGKIRRERVTWGTWRERAAFAVGEQQKRFRGDPYTVWYGCVRD